MSFRRSIVGLSALAALASACAGAPLPASPQPDPSDPSAQPSWASPPASSYVPVLAGTAVYGPVAPKSWQDLNRRVAPDGGRSP